MLTANLSDPAAGTPSGSSPAARPGRISARAASACALVLGVLALALALRLTGLADPTDLSDEGIRGVQLRLLAAGYRPVSEIYASQGPLSLWLFYPLVLLLGPDIVVGRLTAVFASLAIVAAAGWIGRAQAGAVAGVATALVLAVSPAFLENSRLAFVEAPSLAPTVLALAGLLQFRQSGRRWWLLVSATLLAVGTLAKPMAAVAGLPALVLLVAPPDAAAGDLHSTWRRRRIDLALFILIGAAVCALVVLAIGPALIYEQVVAYRLGARASRGWDVLANAQLVRGELMRNGWGIHLAAGLGLVTAATVRRPIGLAVIGWLAAATTALLVYSPLWPKHVTYLLPPLAILAGVGFAQVVGLVARSVTWQRVAPAVVAAAGIVLFAVQLPSLTAETRSIMFRHAGSDMSRYADDLEIVRAATRPDEFVVVDDAYLAMLTGRLVPPPLADLSTSRIGARALSADQAIAETRQYGARVLILQDDHLGGVQRYLAWADREYLLVKGYVQRRPARFRRVYADPGVDLAAIKSVMRASMADRTDVEIGPAVLLGYELERREIKTGSRVDLTLMFESLQDRAPEHALITRLRDTSGTAAWEGEWKLGDGTQELHTWRAGRWQVQTMRLLVDDVPAGSYTLTIALQRPNGSAARVSARSGAEALASGDELSLGEITVLR